MLLLEDLVVLLQRQEEKLLLKCHSKTAVGSSDSKQTFSPVLKLNAVLIRSVATGTRAETSRQAWGMHWVMEAHTGALQDLCPPVFPPVFLS